MQYGYMPPCHFHAVAILSSAPIIWFSQGLLLQSRILTAHSRKLPLNYIRVFHFGAITSHFSAQNNPLSVPPLLQSRDGGLCMMRNKLHLAQTRSIGQDLGAICLDFSAVHPAATRAKEWTYENIVCCAIISKRKEVYLKQNGNCRQPKGSKICGLHKLSTANLFVFWTCLDGFNDSRHGAITRFWQVSALNRVHKYRSAKWQRSLFWTMRTRVTCRLATFTQLPSFPARQLCDLVRGFCSKVEFDC